MDHAQITAVLAQLRLDEARAAHTVTPVATADVRRHLVTLEALLQSHVDREEQLLLPVLDTIGSRP